MLKIDRVPPISVPPKSWQMGAHGRSRREIQVGDPSRRSKEGIQAGDSRRRSKQDIQGGDSGGNLGDRHEAATAEGVEFFLIGVVLLLIVGDLFLEQPVVLEVEGEEAILEDHVVEG
jgi:hypothetical protein